MTDDKLFYLKKIAGIDANGIVINKKQAQENTMNFFSNLEPHKVYKASKNKRLSIQNGKINGIIAFEIYSALFADDFCYVIFNDYEGKIVTYGQYAKKLSEEDVRNVHICFWNYMLNNLDSVENGLSEDYRKSLINHLKSMHSKKINELQNKLDAEHIRFNILIENLNNNKPKLNK